MGPRRMKGSQGGLRLRIKVRLGSPRPPSTYLLSAGSRIARPRPSQLHRLSCKVLQFFFRCKMTTECTVAIRAHV